ncbi:MAG: protein kinase, partial [Gemmatimonadetes bacterium]|nr:protein kinase [Gemmatimonadota bacterium]
MERTAELELDGTELRRLIQLATERVVRFVDTLPSQPAADVGGGAELARSLVEALPEHGTSFAALLDLLFDRVVPKGFNTAGPGYLAYIPGGGLLQAAVADYLGDAVNRYVGVWAAAPGMVQLEANVIRWFGEIVGYPPGAAGFLTSGGSLANFGAIVTARHHLLGEQFLRGTVYASDQTHRSVEKAAALPPIGGEFGNYHILGVLGSGGMGVVYKARQKGLERVVALKVLPAGDQTPGEIVERFFREARAAAKLCHPNIVPVYEVSSQEGSYFYSMELVEGRTLSEHLKGKPLGAREAVEILEKVARAIQYAHENGVIHRDLKPQNVMVDARGKPRVLDFGIAKTLGTKSGLTDTGSAMGTPPYMSPEQAAGSKSVDAR